MELTPEQKQELANKILDGITSRRFEIFYNNMLDNYLNGGDSLSENAPSKEQVLARIIQLFNL
jgi:hypothetical protein